MRIQPTDIPHTAAHYAKACVERGERDIVTHPYIGRDSVKPFVEAGIAVSVIGCIARLTGNHDDCAAVQAELARWEGVSILDCEGTALAVDNCEFCIGIGLDTK